MEIHKDNVRIFITQELGIIIGEWEFANGKNTDGKTYLKYPLRLIPTQEGLSVGGLFGKDEWALVWTERATEVNVTDNVYDIYCKYVNKLHSPIITLDTSIKI